MISVVNLEGDYNNMFAFLLNVTESLTQTQANPTGSTPQPRLSTIQITPTSKISTRNSMLPTPSQAWPTEREDSIQPEERAEYIGALHAVQDLLRQYEMMSAEDKVCNDRHNAV